MRAMAGAAALLRAELSGCRKAGLSRSRDAAGHRGQHHRAGRRPLGHRARPAARQIMQALVRHLHDFAREVRLTEPEWMAAIQWLTRTGQISDEKREEFILASDVLGPVDAGRPDEPPLRQAARPRRRCSARSTSRARRSWGTAGTCPQGLPGAPAVRHRHRPRPRRQGGRRGGARRVAGRRRRRLRGAAADVDEARLRAKYASREDGTYCVRTIAPLGYRIPMDGPVGDLIGADRRSATSARRTSTSCSTCPATSR